MKQKSKLKKKECSHVQVFPNKNRSITHETRHIDAYAFFEENECGWVGQLIVCAIYREHAYILMLTGLTSEQANMVMLARPMSRQIEFQVPGPL